MKHQPQSAPRPCHDDPKVREALLAWARGPVVDALETLRRIKAEAAEKKAA